MAMMDDCSRYSVIECLEFKSDAADAAITILIIWDRDTQKNVTTVRSDGGKVFCDRTLDSFC